MTLRSRVENLPARYYLTGVFSFLLFFAFPAHTPFTLLYSNHRPAIISLLTHWTCTELVTRSLLLSLSNLDPDSKPPPTEHTLSDYRLDYRSDIFLMDGVGLL